MSGMGMRPYSDTDMPRLQDTVAGWIAEAGSCGYDHIGELPHRIYEDRGQGLARAVILHAMRRMQELGLTSVTLNHLASNVPARNLYESIGFTKRHETL